MKTAQSATWTVAYTKLTTQSNIFKPRYLLKCIVIWYKPLCSNAWWSVPQPPYCDENWQLHKMFLHFQLIIFSLKYDRVSDCSILHSLLTSHLLGFVAFTWRNLTAITQGTNLDSVFENFILGITATALKGQVTWLSYSPNIRLVNRITVIVMQRLCW